MSTKKMTTEEYVNTFCKDLRLRKRKAIYVRLDIHQQMGILARRLKRNGHDISISALVSMILINHLNTYWSIHEKLLETAAEIPTTPKDGKASTNTPANKYEDEHDNTPI